MASTPRTRPRPGDIFFMGSVQPVSNWFKQTGYEGSYLSRGRKLQMVAKYGRDERGPTPICLEHPPTKGADKEHGTHDRDVIGYVTGMMMDKSENLIVTAFLYGDRPEVRAAYGEMIGGGRIYGLSAGTFYYEDTPPDGRGRGLPIDATKEFAHIALTPNPDMAEEGSWIYYFGPNEAGISRIIQEHEVPDGIVANRHSLTAWGVPEAVQKRVISILAADISDAVSKGEITPTLFDRELLMASSGTSPTQPEAPAQGDKMDIVTDTSGHQMMDGASAATAAAAPADGAPSGASPQAHAQSILAGLRAAKERIDSIDEEYQKKALLDEVVKQAMEALRASGVQVTDAPPELLSIYQDMRNQAMALDEKIQTMIIETGTAANNRNAELLAEYRNPETNIARRRDIGMLVTASKLGQRQKLVEDELQKERKRREELEAQMRSKDEELSKKRKLEADAESSKISAMERQIDALNRTIQDMTKRQAKSAPLRNPEGAIPSYDFLARAHGYGGGLSSHSSAASSTSTSPSPSSSSSSSSATAFSRNLSSASSPSDYFSVPDPSASGVNTATHLTLTSGLGAASGSARSGSGDIGFINMNVGGTSESGGPVLVTASGGRLPNVITRTASHPWLDNFVLPPDRGSYRHSGTPLFDRLYSSLVNSLDTASAGSAFVHESKESPHGSVIAIRPN